MHTGDRIEFSDVPKECHLNASTFSDSDSFYFLIYLSLYLILDLDSNPNSVFPLMTTLVDSGSFYCFIDFAYVTLHTISAIPILHSILLHFFNGLLGQTITQVITEFPICFPSGDILLLTFYVTPPNSSCSMVLGYS